MFNASAYNAAGFNARSGGIRVILAAATITAGALASADGYKIGAGAVQASVESTLTADRFRYTQGEAHAEAAALMDAGRPYDLATAVMQAGASASADGFGIRAGHGNLSAMASLEAPAIRYAFFADMGASAAMEASALAYRFAGADILSSSAMEAPAVREHAASSELLANAFAQADGLVYAGGITRLEPESYLHAEAHLNGIQTAGTVADAFSELQAPPIRLAGGRTDSDVSLEMTASPVPGRGASVEDGLVTAEMTAVWWTFIGAEADASTESALIADADTIYACRASGSAAASLEANWNIIVEPRGMSITADAELLAEPWRVRPADSEGGVVVDMSAAPERIRLGSVAMDAEAVPSSARASVNLTNPAPPWRQMIIPAEPTEMVVPYENRAMTVT